MALTDLPAADLHRDAPEARSRPDAADGHGPRAAGPVARAVLVLAAALYLTIGLWQAGHDALTVDEAVEVSAGVATLVRHDLRLNPEHPPLPKVLSALPALVARPVVPDTEAWRTNDWFGFTDDFVRANRDAGRLDRIVFLARIVPLLEGLACGAMILRLGRRLFGATAGVAGAVLWLTTPVVAGMSHLAGVDIPFALAALVVADRLLAYVDEPQLRRAAWLGAACAAALLTRHSALSLWAYAVVAVLALGRRVDRRAAVRAAAVVACVGLAGVWVGLRALDPTGPAAPLAAQADALVADASAQSLVARASLAVPFPTEYRAGLAYLVVTSDARPAYLFGESWTGSRVWFFPGSVLAKLPAAALVAVLLAPFALRAAPASTRRRALVAVVGPAAVTFVFLLAQPLNLGVRYVLANLALVDVIAGAAVVWLLARCAPRPRQVVAVLGLASQLVAMAEARTHAISWTAAPFRPAYRWVSDSNVDYGQDTERVARWAEDHPGVWVALLRPRGVDNPHGTRELRGADPATVSGWVAVSATRLTALDRDELSWLRAYCPVGDIGGSVLLYRLAGPPDTSTGPAMPAARCADGDVSTRA